MGQEMTKVTLTIINENLKPGLTEEEIRKHLNPWEQFSPTRMQIKYAVKEIFNGECKVFLGGHHAAVHMLNEDGSARPLSWARRW